MKKIMIVLAILLTGCSNTVELKDIKEMNRIVYNYKDKDIETPLRYFEYKGVTYVNVEDVLMNLEDAIYAQNIRYSFDYESSNEGVKVFNDNTEVLFKPNGVIDFSVYTTDKKMYEGFNRVSGDVLDFKQLGSNSYGFFTVFEIDFLYDGEIEEKNYEYSFDLNQSNTEIFDIDGLFYPLHTVSFVLNSYKDMTFNIDEEKGMFEFVGKDLVMGDELTKEVKQYTQGFVQFVLREYSSSSSYYEDGINQIITEKVPLMNDSFTKDLKTSFSNATTDHSSITIKGESKDYRPLEQVQKEIDDKLYITLLGFSFFDYGVLNEITSTAQEEIVIDIRNVVTSSFYDMLNFYSKIDPSFSVFYEADIPLEVTYNREGEALNKNIYLITDNTVGEAGALFAGLMQDNHSATIIGTPTKGLGFYSKEFLLPDGSTIDVEVGGVLFARADGSNYINGVIPDYEVELTDIESIMEFIDSIK